MCFAREWNQVAGAGLLALSLLAGCDKGDKAYPPAIPAKFQLPWDNSEPFVPRTPPPVELMPSPARVRFANLPAPDEWTQWRAHVEPVKVCRGKGKRRVCKSVVPTAVDKANSMAVVKPSADKMAGGQSVELRFTYDPREPKIYQFPVSTQEFTRIILPPQEELAHKLRLDPQDWEVMYGDSAKEGAQVESIAIRAMKPGIKGRDLLLTRSGIRLYIQPLGQERLGALAVLWELPEVTKMPKPEPVALDKAPPKFNGDLAYAAYTLKSEAKGGIQPPWYPKAVVDDGRNTMIQFGILLEGQRMPVVSGVQQNGKPAIVASRLYQHPEHPEYGSWMYVQGLWPALQLVDAAGMKVTMTREVPKERGGAREKY